MKTVAITGATVGIGRATAKVMAREGATVVCVDNHPERLDAAVVLPFVRMKLEYLEGLAVPKGDAWRLKPRCGCSSMHRTSSIRCEA